MKKSPNINLSVFQLQRKSREELTRNESHINSIIITGITDFWQILIHRVGLHVHCNKKNLVIHVFLLNCKLCIAADGSDHYINDHNLVNPE